MFCNMCEMKHEMRESMMKPSHFALAQMRFTLPKRLHMCRWSHFEIGVNFMT